MNIFGRKKEQEAKAFDDRLQAFVVADEVSEEEQDIENQGAEVEEEQIAVPTSVGEENNTATEIETLDEPEAIEEIVPVPVVTPVVADITLKPLFAGAYLNGELEIKDVLARGPVNFYLADAGDYGSHDLRLIAERALPEAGDNVIEVELESALFPAATRFTQADREYAVWPYENLKPLVDWSPSANDETYLNAMKTLATGLLEAQNERLSISALSDALYIDADENLRVFGFFNEATEGLVASNLGVISAISSRLARNNFAAHATLRLDDEFGALPLSDETKSFARTLANGEFESLEAVVESLNSFTPLDKAEIALLSDVGIERELNEDSGLTLRLSRVGEARNQQLDVLAVADGMGGHEGGEVASSLALDTLQTSILKRLALNWDDNAQVIEAMNQIGDEVNAAVLRMNENPPYAASRHKPGTTLVWAIRVGSRVFIGNIGDSRAYRWNAESGLERLTKDHSYVQDLIDTGRLSPDEAWGHPDGSIITSHVGMPRGMLKDVFIRMLSAGDRLVLVSDGVVDTMRDEEIEKVISGAQSAPELTAALVAAANEGGGIDNITVAVLWATS
jgi:serine/threonine protein phosphatase PrpC